MRDIDRPAFIRHNTRAAPVGLVPEIRLYLADDATALWQQTEADLETIGLPPPFWAFAWAGGQALARYILDRPDAVRSRRVLDFACGSGLVAIAAALAGAATVSAHDIEGFALEATALNAALNGVDVVCMAADLLGQDVNCDVILAADVFYEQGTASAVTEWLHRQVARGCEVIVGDPRRTYFQASRFEQLAAYDVPVMPSLEDVAVKQSFVWRMKN